VEKPREQSVLSARPAPASPAARNDVPDHQGDGDDRRSNGHDGDGRGSNDHAKLLSPVRPQETRLARGLARREPCYRPRLLELTKVG
jgi:hypothetical protein